MRGRGVVSVQTSGLARLVATGMSLFLILAWPVTGAGSRGGDYRGAIRLAVQVDASATLLVGASLEGRHWPGGNYVGRPHS